MDTCKPDTDHSYVRFAPGCPFPSVWKCSCGFNFLNQTPSVQFKNKTKKLEKFTINELFSGNFSLLASEARQVAMHHFRSVYHTKGDGSPKHGTTRFPLHRMVQLHFRPDLSPSANVELIMKIISEEKKKANSIKQKRIWLPTERSDLYNAILVAVISYYPVHHLWKGPMKYSDKLRYELLLKQDPEMARRFLETVETQ